MRRDRDNSWHKSNSRLSHTGAVRLARLSRTTFENVANAGSRSARPAAAFGTLSNLCGSRPLGPRVDACKALLMCRNLVNYRAKSESVDHLPVELQVGVIADCGQPRARFVVCGETSGAHERHPLSAGMAVLFLGSLRFRKVTGICGVNMRK